MQKLNEAPSRLHSKLVVVPVPVKTKLALALLVTPPGLDVIVVLGAMVSMVQV
jgi:hypothetical protein